MRRSRGRAGGRRHHRFWADAARAIGQHAPDCEACAADRDEVLAPERLFAMVPIALAPPLLKSRAAAALEAGGVPMSGSDHAPCGPSGRRRRRWRGLAAAGVAAVMIIGLVVALAGRAGDGELGTSAIDATEGTSTGAAGSTPGPTPPSRSPATTSSAPTSTTADPAAGTPTDPTAPPVTSSRTIVTSTSTSRPAPPTIGGFRASLQRGACEQELPGTAIVWQSTSRATQSVGAPDGSATPVGSEGSQVFCPHQPGTWTLTVTGPGGIATATAGA
jgi:hypothetical protein